VMTGPRVLVVDDEVELCTFFRHLLQRKGYDVVTACSGDEALEELQDAGYGFRLALLDLKLPDTDGIALLRRIKGQNPACEVIIMTGYSTIKSAVEAIQLGAFDYIEKPFDVIEDLEALIGRALDLKSREADWDEMTRRFGFVVGKNPRMRRLMTAAQKIARKNITVLICGETGTGKEVLARFIHQAGHRSDYPFIAVNCAAFTETLLESELFGHEKGSFTGASRPRRGIFEVADRGTLFLDEVGSASVSIQTRLLRVLETGEFLRVGGEEIQTGDVRVIAATNIDLEEAVARGAFRQDLLYRLDVASLELPPLRERAEDIPMFVEFFLEKVRSKEDGRVRRVSAAALEMIQSYHWPGNIRELANVVTQATALAEGAVIQPQHLPRKLLDRTPASAGPSGRREAPARSETEPRPAAEPEPAPGSPSPAPPRVAAIPGEGEAAEVDPQRLHRLIVDWTEREAVAGVADGRVDLEALLGQLKASTAEVARRLIRRALQQTMGRQKEAAELLGISTRTLRYLHREKDRQS